MTRAALTPTTITALTSNGYNLTDSSDFTTMSTGSGNGVEFTYDANDIVILLNDSGGAAAYTFVIAVGGQITSVGGTVTDPDITVADGKTHILPALPAAFKQSDGKVYVDCDVAGKILVLNR